MHDKNAISIWFFIGIALLVNGGLILGSGIYEIFNPPANPVVLFHLHASAWWGGILFVIGIAYTFYFSPHRQAR